MGLNYKSIEDFEDSVVLNFGTPIASKDYENLNLNASVLRMKSNVHNALIVLTTQMDVEDYDDILQKLENINVDFLNPEDVNQCVKSNFKDCNTLPNQNLRRPFVLPWSSVWCLFSCWLWQSSYGLILAFLMRFCI
ncbi:hypothetical protein [Gelidibacter sp.]|uniref:hypothetical protein n=1 Tax=Gelidibacter sp. TaxID=2018083 RepID=UPI0032672C82